MSLCAIQVDWGWGRADPDTYKVWRQIFAMVRCRSVLVITATRSMSSHETTRAGIRKQIITNIFCLGFIINGVQPGLERWLWIRVLPALAENPGFQHLYWAAHNQL